MKANKIILFVTLLLIVCHSNAQRKTTKYATATKADVKCSNSFPACFIGNWKGKLQWMVAGKATQTFTMRLRIQPTDSANQYTWQIIYGDAGKDNRPYILKPIDTAKGHWVVDERDGIMLDSYVHGNSLHGAFTVQGNTIVDNYTIENGKMRVEFFSIKLGDKKQSGKGTEETPFVDSYKISSYQTGVLTRVK
jgi:hypothetical protein